MKQIGAEVFGELRYMVLMENAEDEMVRGKVTNGEVLERIGKSVAFFMMPLKNSWRK
jgi:hypothetical protein